MSENFSKNDLAKTCLSPAPAGAGRVVFAIFEKLFANAERMNDIIKNLSN